MTAATNLGAPKVWIGCLACYNDGRLVGDWHDASEAENVNTDDVHGQASPHDELWCFDTENVPVHREMDPREAAQWGRVFGDVDDHLRRALYAWVAHGEYVAEDTSDLPVVSEFLDRYCGQWDSFEDYARNLAADTAMFENLPPELEQYFDWSSYARDLAYDYNTIQADSWVYVFRSY